MKKSSIIAIVCLILLTLAALLVAAWALWLRNPQPIYAPDYAPIETEPNAEPLDEPDSEKMEAEQGGGAVSLTYTKSVEISISEKQASLSFANPGKSTQDMVLQLVIGDMLLAQSGRLVPGNRVDRLELEPDVEQRIQPGGYDGKIIVSFYCQDNGEKAIVNTEIPVLITVIS